MNWWVGAKRFGVSLEAQGKPKGRDIARIFARTLGTEKYLPPPPREQEKIIFRGKLWLHPPLR